MTYHDKFARLFEGRTDVHGTIPAGQAEGGLCVEQPLTRDTWFAHLNGDYSIGVYPLVETEVHWGCTDVDFGYEKSWVPVQNLQRALKALNIPSHIERTKGKGYHVWVFLPDGIWVPAEVMRNALLVAHQLADVPPKEVNPKQLTGKYGNYVNVVYCRKWVLEGKRVMVNRLGQQISLDTWLRIMEDPDEYATVDALKRAASLYHPPTPVRQVALNTPHSVDVAELPESVRAALPGLAWTIYHEGPLPDRETGRVDRSDAMVRLARLCAEHGMDADDTYLVLRTWQWNKFVGRQDEEEQLLKILNLAYASGTEGTR